MNKRPNFLFITCDQLRKDALGCYGNHIVKTPNIDNLAERGIRFEHMYTASPICAPNRASISTGRYPSICGMPYNGCVLPQNEFTMMEALRISGYATYGVGKMHFKPQFDWKADSYNEFMAARNGEGYVNPQPYLWELPYYGFEKVCLSEDNRVGPYEEYLERHGLDPYADPHSFTYGQHATVRSSWPEEHHQTTWIANRTIDFINEHQDERPFFMWTSFVHPHHPFNPPAPYDAMYNTEDMPLPLYSEDEVEGWPESYKVKFYATEGGHEAVGLCNFTNEDWKRIKAYYYGMISLIDKQVGKIIYALKEKGMLDNTVVIFTSDHGEMLGDHRLCFKGTFYDCVTNMPFIITLPGNTQSGEKKLQMVNAIDIMPTVLQLAGLSIPKSVQGKSLLPLLGRNSAFNEREEIFMEFIDDRRAIRTMDTLFVWHGYNAKGELYDLKSDPYCFRNLWDNQQYSDIKQEMTERLIKNLVRNYDPNYARVCLC